MNREILPHVTTAQAILVLVAANLIAMGYLTSLTNYNHDIATDTQQKIISLLSAQGNISVSQREKIIQAFESLPPDVATVQNQKEIHHLLIEILGNVTHPK